MRTLGELKAQIEKLANQAGILPELIPSFGKFSGAESEVFMDGDKYHFIANGNQVSTNNAEELIYIVFQEMTKQMGYIYEVEHRDAKSDSRRIAFRRQLEILENLNLDWKKRREKEIEELLKWYPYNDQE